MSPTLTICKGCDEPFTGKQTKQKYCTAICRRESEAKARLAQVNELMSVEAAWLAAIIDGEGCIGLRDYANGRHVPYARINVVNTYLPLLQRCQQWTNVGNIYPRKAKSKKAHWKDQWGWTVQVVQAARILQQVEPWLLEKRERAREAIAIHVHQVSTCQP